MASNGVSFTVTGTVMNTIQYVQSNYADPQASQSPISVPFVGAQSAGDLNVVVVGWSDSTTQVSSVTDTKGNNYILAVGPTVVNGYESRRSTMRRISRARRRTGTR